MSHGTGSASPAHTATSPWQVSASHLARTSHTVQIVQYSFSQRSALPVISISVVGFLYCLHRLLIFVITKVLEAPGLSLLMVPTGTTPASAAQYAQPAQQARVSYQTRMASYAQSVLRKLWKLILLKLEIKVLILLCQYIYINQDKQNSRKFNNLLFLLCFLSLFLLLGVLTCFYLLTNYPLFDQNDNVLLPDLFNIKKQQTLLFATMINNNIGF